MNNNMSNIETVSQISTAEKFPQPVDFRPEEITMLNERGEREYFPPLRIIDECREALAMMKPGEYGVVVGSGPNTEKWRGKGWLTLDIDPQYGTNYVCDANWMEQQIPPNCLDYIFAESIRFDPEGDEGVSPARLLDQANVTLKEGGKLIIQSAYFYPNEDKVNTTLPDRNKYMDLMTEHGFQTAVEIREIRGGKEGVGISQQVIYYGEKKASGYDPKRVTPY